MAYPGIQEFQISGCGRNLGAWGLFWCTFTHTPCVWKGGVCVLALDLPLTCMCRYTCTCVCTASCTCTCIRINLTPLYSTGIQNLTSKMFLVLCVDKILSFLCRWIRYNVSRQIYSVHLYIQVSYLHVPGTLQFIDSLHN